MTSTTTGPRTAKVSLSSAPKWVRNWPLWVLLVPGLFLATLFKFIPMFQGIIFGFQKVQPYKGNEFVGIDNYVTVLTSPLFRDAMWHTVVLAAVQTVGAVVVGLCLALLLEGSGLGLWITRTIVVLPIVTAMAVIGEIWRIIFFPASNGLLNRFLGVFGLGPAYFFDSPNTALMSIAVVGIWAGAPSNMVIFLAGLAGIDRNLYEAASVDGVSTWRRIRSIVIPGLAGSFVIIITLSAIRALGIFTEVYVLTGGGPAGSTATWMTTTYSQGFERNNIGVASAASMVLLCVTLALTAFARKMTGRIDR